MSSNIQVRYHDWIEIAEEQAEKTENPKLFISLGLLGGLGAYTLLNPLTGLATLAYCAYLAYQANERNSEQIEAVDDGLIAHLLDRKQIRQYSNSVGVERVAEELAEAAKRELPFTDDASLFAKTLNQKTLTAAPEAQALPPATPEPEQPKPTIGPQTRLGAVTVAAEACEDDAEPTTPRIPAQPYIAPTGPQQWDEDEPLQKVKGPDSMALLQECLHYPSILVYGPPGAGKSTLAEWLIYERIKLGHIAEILDPHREYGQWEGLPTYGDGMNFGECDERLEFFLDLVESRYQQRASRPNFSPRPVTLLCEEFTSWAKRCKWAGKFFETSVSDIRKINCHVVYVSHARTMTAIGGSNGLAATRDSALLEIGLDAHVDPETGKATPTGRGRIYYPGRKKEPIEIVLPNLTIERPSTEPTARQEPSRSPSLEASYSADSSDEVVGWVAEVLATAEEPLLASVILQRKYALKKQFKTGELEAKLRLMAMEGFIQSDGSEPPKYTLANAS